MAQTEEPKPSEIQETEETYEPPRIVESAGFDRLALGCLKADALCDPSQGAS